MSTAPSRAQDTASILEPFGLAGFPYDPEGNLPSLDEWADLMTKRALEQEENGVPVAEVLTQLADEINKTLGEWGLDAAQAEAQTRDALRQGHRAALSEVAGHVAFLRFMAQHPETRAAVVDVAREAARQSATDGGQAANGGDPAR